MKLIKPLLVSFLALALALAASLPAQACYTVYDAASRVVYR